MLHNIELFPEHHSIREKKLSEKPFIHPTALVHKSKIGSWTEIGMNSIIIESVFDDFSYEAGNVQIIYCDLYNHLFSSGKKGKTQGIAYIKPTYVDAKEAIRAIIQSNGIPVLAHPALNDNYDAIPELVDAGLTGLELKHSKHTLKDENKILEYAHKYNLMTTGGSDYHGFYGESCEMLGNNNPGIDCINTLKNKQGSMLPCLFMTTHFILSIIQI
ncbi:MAG: hypothetical protein KAT05_17150 [Spirochaetes bacterium]|nr:hypothetical protein [Spirochaetota bacterium]